MKAAVYYETGPPDVFRYEDVADPVCGPGDVLVDIEAISIEGGDTLNRGGGEMSRTPHIVGYQSAGTIAAVGEDVRDRSVGQRVVASFLEGSHAERIAVPSLVTWVVPEGLGTVEAACVPIAFGTADDCLFEFGRPRRGRDGSRAGGRRRRGHRRDPARGARRSHGARDRVQRRAAGAPP